MLLRSIFVLKIMKIVDFVFENNGVQILIDWFTLRGAPMRAESMLDSKTFLYPHRPSRPSVR